MSLKKRGQINVLRRGCNGTPSLVEFDSLPSKYRQAWELLHGDPNEQAAKDTVLNRIVLDEKAQQYYRDFQLSNGDNLKFEVQTQYTNEASILNTINAIINNRVAMRVPKGAAPDMPGVLRAGSVSVNGASAGAWGYRKAAPARNSQGAYRITHHIGHTNYYFSGTLIGGFTGAVKIMNKQTSYIDVEVRGLDGNLYDCGFDYMICGANYNT